MTDVKIDPITTDRTLRTDEATLRAVAAAANGGTLPPGAAADAEQVALARDDGTLTDLGWIVGRTIAAPALTIRLRRLEAGEATQLLIRASPAAVIVSPPPDEHVGSADIRVAPPDGLVRTCSYLLDTDDRVPTGRTSVEVDGDPLAPFLGDEPSGWTRQVGADRARLLRLELAVGDRMASLVLADLGAAGLWSADGDGDAGTSPLRWVPTDGVVLLRELARLQELLLGEVERGGLPTDRRVVELSDVGVRVEVPPGWERLEVAAPMALVARTPDGHRAPANVTVAVDEAPEVDDAVGIARLIADALPAGRVVSAVQHAPGDRRATYLHAGTRGDLLTLQLQLDVGGRTVLMSVTADATSADAWLDEAVTWVESLATSTWADRHSDQAEPSTPDSLDSAEMGP